jgi:hypothetical protein
VEGAKRDWRGSEGLGADMCLSARVRSETVAAMGPTMDMEEFLVQVREWEVLRP